MLCPSLEPSRRDGSNEGSQHMFSLRNKKNIFELSSVPPLIWSSSDTFFLPLNQTYDLNVVGQRLRQTNRSKFFASLLSVMITSVICL